MIFGQVFITVWYSTGHKLKACRFYLFSLEIIRIDGKDSDHIARKFAQCWLTCYPRPQCCIHDPGGEFTGPEFQTLLQNCHIRDVCTTAKNPQSNAVCVRMHQTVGNVLRTLLHGEPPQNIANAKEYKDEAAFIAMHAMRAGIHSTLIRSSTMSLTALLFC